MPPKADETQLYCDVWTANATTGSHVNVHLRLRYWPLVMSAAISPEGARLLARRLVEMADEAETEHHDAPQA